jgi:hypothetical protein
VRNTLDWESGTKHNLDDEPLPTSFDSARPIVHLFKRIDGEIRYVSEEEKEGGETRPS